MGVPLTKLPELLIGKSGDPVDLIPPEMAKLLKRHGTSKTLSVAFFGDFNAVWERYGLQAMVWLALNDPGRFVEVAAKMSKVTRLEVGTPGEFDRPRSRSEVLDKMEERAGVRGREMLAAFLEKLDAMEKGEPAQVIDNVEDKA